MAIYILLRLVILLFASRVSSQKIVQDDWLMPALPERSFTFMSGNKYTLNWRSSLQDWFADFCQDCNTTSVDLWVFNSDETKYSAKVARGIDVTTTESFDWVVNVDPKNSTIDDSWGFRFLPLDYEDTSGGEISSPTFAISGLEEKSSETTEDDKTSTVTTNTATTSTATATSATESSSTATSSPSPSGSVHETSSPDSASRSKVWIAGVVVGPLIGICAGAALVWFFLRKRQKKASHKGHELMNTYDGNMSNQDAKPVYSYHRPPYALEAAGNRSPVEVPSQSTYRPPAELGS